MFNRKTEILVESIQKELIAKAEYDNFTEIKETEIESPQMSIQTPEGAI